MSDWLNPLNRIRFQAAFRKKAPQVVLTDGRQFSLAYADGNVMVHPIPTIEHPNEFVPMGVFSLKVVTDVLWLAE